MVTNRPPLVSILCLAYNQKNFIRETIEGFLMQKTNFSVEILINDDASSDGTKEIIEEYANKNDNVVGVFHQTNRYSSGERNLLIRYLLPKVQGRYIAVCDGDDMWTDPDKLQRQVNFLEENPDFSLVFHSVEVISDQKHGAVETVPNKTDDLTLERLVQDNFIPSNSVVYRARDAYNRMPTDFMPGDWYLHIFHARFGKIGFIDKPMAIYRTHTGGIWHGSSSPDLLFWKRYAQLQLNFFREVRQLFADDGIENRLYVDRAERIFILNIVNFYKNFGHDEIFFTNFFRTNSETLVRALSSLESQLGDAQGQIMKEAEAYRLSREELARKDDLLSTLESERDELLAAHSHGANYALHFAKDKFDRLLRRSHD